MIQPKAGSAFPTPKVNKKKKKKKQNNQEPMQTNQVRHGDEVVTVMPATCTVKNQDLTVAMVQPKAGTTSVHKVTKKKKKENRCKKCEENCTNEAVTCNTCQLHTHMHVKE